MVAHGDRKRRLSKRERKLLQRTSKDLQEETGQKKNEVQKASVQMKPSKTARSKRKKRCDKVSACVVACYEQESVATPPPKRVKIQETGRISKKTKLGSNGADSSKREEGKRFEAGADEPCVSAGQSLKTGKKKAKKKDKQQRHIQETASASKFSSEAERILKLLRDPASPGTLSDRLNPTHPHFDKHLKASWKTLSKKERAAVVECDQQQMKATVSAEVSIKHPFDVNDDDHCETAVEAYRDIAPILKHLATALGKTPAELNIYDPYFCAGGVVNRLGELGFSSVYNKCEDFYAVMREKRVPDHDVLLTNPPYSGDHVERLLRWCRSNGKPFLLLMPNYFCVKDYYESALGGPKAMKSMLYLCPRKRYSYWTPKGMRSRDRVQSQHASSAGNRTSPFVSFWYLDLAPVLPAAALLRWWEGCEADAQGTTLCKLASMPHGCKP